jgi:hypothetical protein
MKTSCHLDIEIKERIISCEVICDYIPGDQGDWMTPPSPPDIDIEIIVVKSIELFDGIRIPTEWLLVTDWYNIAKNLVWDQLLLDNNTWCRLCEAIEDSLDD